MWNDLKEAIVVLFCAIVITNLFAVNDLKIFVLIESDNPLNPLRVLKHFAGKVVDCTERNFEAILIEVESICCSIGSILNSDRNIRLLTVDENLEALSSIYCYHSVANNRHDTTDVRRYLNFRVEVKLDRFLKLICANEDRLDRLARPFKFVSLSH